MAADLIRLLGDPWVADLDLDQLERLPSEYVSNDLRTRRADLPWWAPFKPGTGHPAGAGVMFHIEFQSNPDAHMAERLLEYVALLPRELRRSGWMAAEGGRIVTHVPLGGVQRPRQVERAAAAGRARVGAVGTARHAAAPALPAD